MPALKFNTRYLKIEFELYPRRGFKPLRGYNSDKKTYVLRDEVLQLFGGEDNFEFIHQQNAGSEI